MMIESILEDWIGVRLDAVCSKPQYGYTTKAANDGDVKFLRTTDITKGKFSWSEVPFCEVPPKDTEKYQLRDRDIVISRAGSIGFSCLLTDPPEKSVFASYLIRFEPSRSVSEIFLKHFLKSPGYWDQLKAMSAGNAVQNVNAKKLSEITLPLPSLAEQKIIADKLDTLLAQVETTKARLERIPVILKRFRQSVLADAVSGKLTEDWRGQHCPRDYQWGFQKVSDIVSRIEAGKNIRCIETPPQENEYGIVKISAVTWGSYNEAESKTLPSSKNFIEKRRVKVGDFLISRANTIELLGSPVIVHKVRKNLMLSDKVLRLVMKNEDKPWLDIFLRSQNGRKEIEARATGNQQSMRNIGQKALLDIDLPKPSPDEQSEIVRRVEQFFAYADSIEQQVQAALARVNNLTQSILAKAFRGELTADWRAANPDLISGDNSAEALLEKIKAEREALAKQPKKRKPAVKKKTGKKMSKQITRVVDQ